MNIKSRVERPDTYPIRFPVPNDKVSWHVPFPEYNPETFTDACVLDEFREHGKDGWADPEIIQIEELENRRRIIQSVTPVILDARGCRLNPGGRTGLRGRGELGRWEVNEAADPVVITQKPDGRFYMIAIERQDTGQIAIPGGMRDKKETSITDTLTRELEEETTLKVDMRDSIIVHRGLVDDRRNTDESWIETTVALKFVPWSEAQRFQPCGCDDAKEAYWHELSPVNIERLYASHQFFVAIALAEARKRIHSCLS